MFACEQNTFGLQFSTAGVNVNTNDLYFETPNQGIQVSNGDSSSVSLRLNYGGGKYIDYIYSLKGESYLVGLNIVTKGMQDRSEEHTSELQSRENLVCRLLL